MSTAHLHSVRGVSRFEDLVAYKLAVELRAEIVTRSSTGAAARDYKFVAQIRDAARGGPRNIAEGFARFAPLEFHKFLSYAKASIDETKSHVYDGHESGYFSDADRDRLLSLARRTAAAITRLMGYLESPEARRAYERLRNRIRPDRNQSKPATETHRTRTENPEPGTGNLEPSNQELSNPEPGTGNREP